MQRLQMQHDGHGGTSSGWALSSSMPGLVPIMASASRLCPANLSSGRIHSDVELWQLGMQRPQLQNGGLGGGSCLSSWEEPVL